VKFYVEGICSENVGNITSLTSYNEFMHRLTYYRSVPSLGHEKLKYVISYVCMPK